MSFFPRMTSLAPLSAGPYRHHEFTPFLSLFNDTFNELQRVATNTAEGRGGTTFAPRFDVKEEKEKYLLEGELPGIEQKNISIEFTDDHTLMIKGRTERYSESGKPSVEEVHDKPDAQSTEASSESKDAEEGKEASAPTTTAMTTTQEPQATYWVSERSIGEFSRTFSFPTRVDQDAVTASLKNGILSVAVPKMLKTAQKKKIQIE